LAVAGQTVYSFTVRLVVTASMSESLYVIVYHVRDDGETIADRALVNVQQCSDNQVRLDLRTGDVNEATEE